MKIGLRADNITILNRIIGQKCHVVADFSNLLSVLKQKVTKNSRLFKI